MAYARVYIPGDRLIDCERCGFTVRHSQIRRETDRSDKGLLVCPECFDGVHPLDLPPPAGRAEGKLVPPIGGGTATTTSTDLVFYYGVGAYGVGPYGEGS